MNEKNKLTLYMGILYMLAILFFGIILIDDKAKDYKIPQAEKKLKTYIKNTYKEEIKDFTYGKTKRHGSRYDIKVYNKKNKDLYFTVSYENKKITDTYKKDYVEGKTLNKNIEKYLNNMINEEIKQNKNNYTTYKIVYNTKLNNCTTFVRNKLLNKTYNIPIYTIYVETSFNNNLEDVLTNILNYTKKLNLTPKDYHLILNNENNLSKSIDLKIDNDIIEESIKEIVKCIKENDFNTLRKYNVEVKYLN